MRLRFVFVTASIMAVVYPAFGEPRPKDGHLLRLSMRSRPPACKALPPIDLVLVLDRSGSMVGQKMAMVKRIGESVLKRLCRRDRVGFISFNHSAHLVWKLQGGNKKKALASLRRVRAEGGTSMRPALEMAAKALGASPTKAKRKRHVLLISDGQTSYTGIPELLKQMSDAKISVSAFGLGPQADYRLLGMIAQQTKGRFYEIPNPKALLNKCLYEMMRIRR